MNNTIRHYTKLGSLVGHLARRIVLNRAGRGIVNEVAEEGGGSGAGPTSAFRRCWEVDRRRLLGMRDLAERHGARFILMPGGPRDQALVTRGWNRNIPYFVEEMAALPGKHAIECVDIAGAVVGRDIYALTMLPVDGHPSALWNRLAAEAVHRILAGAGPVRGEVARQVNR